MEKKRKITILDRTGEADMAALKAGAAAYYQHAREAGRLVIAHPITGRPMPSAEFDAEVQARQAMHDQGLTTHGVDYWTAPIDAGQLREPVS